MGVRSGGSVPRKAFGFSWRWARRCIPRREASVSSSGAARSTGSGEVRMSTLTDREMSLVALGAAVASNCVPCVEYHVPVAPCCWPSSRGADSRAAGRRRVVGAGAAVVVGSTAAARGVRRLSFRKENEVSETILVGRGRNITEMPRRDWEEALRSAPERIGQRLLTQERFLLVRRTRPRAPVGQPPGRWDLPDPRAELCVDPHRSGSAVRLRARRVTTQPGPTPCAS